MVGIWCYDSLGGVNGHEEAAPEVGLFIMPPGVLGLGAGGGGAPAMSPSYSIIKELHELIPHRGNVYRLRNSFGPSLF